MRTCKIDLGVAYTLTALFGIAMVIIGTKLPVEPAERARFSVVLADQLVGALGPWSKWIFLVGFWGAVFSSLLGVWQSAPYFFADFIHIRGRETQESADPEELSKSLPYKAFLLFIATVPLVTLWYKLEAIQLMYAVLGAFFMPLLALTLLIMNNRKKWVGEKFTNGWFINGALVATLLFFMYAGITKIIKVLG